MANVPAGLFLTPGVVQQAQQAPAMSRDQMQNALRGSMFNLGGATGRGITQAFGGDPRSPQEKRAAELQGIVSQMNFNDPQSITDTMNSLNQQGFQAEALKLLEALPSPTTPQKRIVDEWVQVTGQGDTTRRSLFQRDNLGFIHEVGAVTDTAQLGTFKGLGDEWQRDVQYDTDSRDTFLGRVSQLPTFKSLVGDTDPESLKQFTGLIAKVANDMKDNQRRAINQALMDGKITTQEANMAVAPSDDWYLNAAYQRYEAAGGIEANIKTGLGIQGAGVSLLPRTDTTDPQALQKRLERNDKRAQAIVDVANRTGTLVKGDPRTGEFTVGGLEPGQAAQVFSRMDKKSDEEIMQQLTQLKDSEGRNFQFTPEMFESHAKVWQIMRENAGVTAKFVNLADNKDLMNAEASRVLDEYDQNDNFHGFATAARIIRYLGRLGPTAAQKNQQKNVQEIQESIGGKGA